MLDTVRSRIAFLPNVCAMSRLTSDRRPANTLQVQLDLITLVAAQTPQYWMDVQLPTDSAAAAAYADTTVCDAAATVLHFHDSPPDRATLAMQCLRLSANDAGVNLPRLHDTRAARFATTYRRLSFAGPLPDS